MFSLAELGFDEFFRAHFEHYRAAAGLENAHALRPARVVRRDREAWLVHDGAREQHVGLSGQLRRQITSPEGLPAVGDWIVLSAGHDAGLARLAGVLPRRSVLLRKAAGSATLPQAIAANVDWVLVVVALDRDFSPRRIERYVAAARDSGALTAILLSKADLVDDDAPYHRQVRVASEVPVLALSAVTGFGLPQLRELLKPGSTSVLVGSSGVGKSTLINTLLGHDRQPTHAVRARDERGCHTTSRREMLALPGGALLIDTPGMREFVGWMDEENLDLAFEDVESRTSSCRFRNCRHQGEPGCAVAEAIARGDLDPDRVDNYNKQRQELHGIRRRRDEQSRQREARGKAIARLARGLKKHGGKWS